LNLKNLLHWFHGSDSFLYDPDYLVSPGETIYECAIEKNLSLYQLSQKLELPPEAIENDGWWGEITITPEMAIKLEVVLGPPASFWTNLWNNYQKRRTRLKWRYVGRMIGNLVYGVLMAVGFVTMSGLVLGQLTLSQANVTSIMIIGTILGTILDFARANEIASQLWPEE
jgi:plasmid maintenance system antidote protein VapI